MSNKFNKMKFVIVSLAFLQAFNGLSALIGGFGLINDPTGAAIGMELDWLKTTPFYSYLIPGIVLFSLNGIGNITGLWFTISRKAKAGKLGSFFGVIMLIWILAQVFWIGYKSFLQPLYFGTGLFQLFLGVFFNKYILK